MRVAKIEGLIQPSWCPQCRGACPLGDCRTLQKIDKRIAVLVGVGAYDDASVRNLTGHLDVQNLKGVLEANGFGLIVCLCDGGDGLPTRERVLEQLVTLKALATNGELTPSSLIFFFFAGHGIRREGVGQVEAVPRVENGTRQLLMKDAKPKLLGEGLSDSKCMTVDEIQQQLLKTGSRRIVIMLDACHQGVDLGGRGGFEPESDSFDVYHQAGGVVVLSASSARQMAQDTTKGGLYTRCFVKGLTAAPGGEHLNADSNKSGVVTMQEIAAYTSVQVRDRQFKQGAGKRIQLPTFDLQGHGEVAFVDRRGAAAVAGAEAALAAAVSALGMSMSISSGGSSGTNEKYSDDEGSDDEGS
jgi:hypothetical protein